MHSAFMSEKNATTTHCNRKKSLSCCCDWPKKASACCASWAATRSYSGGEAMTSLCTELIAHGLPGTTPVAIVQQCTTKNQRVITGTLATLPGNAEVDEL